MAEKQAYSNIHNWNYNYNNQSAASSAPISNLNNNTPQVGYNPSLYNVAPIQAENGYASYPQSNPVQPHFAPPQTNSVKPKVPEGSEKLSTNENGIFESMVKDQEPSQSQGLIGGDQSDVKDSLCELYSALDSGSDDADYSQLESEMSTTTVCVKAYLELPNEDPEIRRFFVDQDVSTSYEYLKGKIENLFAPRHRLGPFTVYWEDPENDRIALSSDEELIQALMFGTGTDGKILKIFIRSIQQKGQAKSSKPTADGPEHPGVVCDSCESGIHGLRYKCLVCPDYDLCQDCCDKGQHNQHYMLRIARPATDWPCGGASGRGGQWANPMSGPRGHGWWGPGSGMRKWWRNLMRQQPGCNAFTDMPTERTAENQGQSQATEVECPNKESERDYLMHIGEQVAAMMEPLGINVDISVEEREKRREMRREQKAARGGGRGCGEGQKLGGCHKAGMWKAQCEKRGKASAVAKAAAMAKEQKPVDDSVEEVASTSTSAPAEATTSAATGAAGAAAAPEEAAPMEPAPMESSSEEPDQSWVKVDSKQNDDMDVVVLPQRDGDVSTLYPELPKPSAPQQAPALVPQQVPVVTPQSAPASAPQHAPASAPQHAPASAPQQARVPSYQPPAPRTLDQIALDQKVVEAIEQMRAMGFHDEGGWMTSLLYQNNGDVYKVIDSVLRRAHSQ